MAGELGLCCFDWEGGREALVGEDELFGKRRGNGCGRYGAWKRSLRYFGESEMILLMPRMLRKPLSR